MVFVLLILARGYFFQCFLERVGVREVESGRVERERERDPSM